MNECDNSAKLFKALMHPARLEILETLRDGEHCVCHIEAALGYRQAYISQQLSVLREAGLIQDRRDGWNIYYRVIQPKVFDVLDTAQAMNSTQRTRHKQTLDNCPCPQCSPAETAAV